MQISHWNLIPRRAWLRTRPKNRELWQWPGYAPSRCNVWSPGVKARPRGMSRFDTPSHSVEVAECHAPPTRVRAPEGTPLPIPSHSPLVECLLHSFEMASKPISCGSRSWCMGTDRPDTGGCMPCAADEGWSAARRSPPHALRLPTGRVLVA